MKLIHRRDNYQRSLNADGPLLCDECGSDRERLVHFGAEPEDWDGEGRQLCGECLTKALALLAAEGSVS